MNLRQLFFATLLFLVSFGSYGQTESVPVYLKFRADKYFILEAEDIEIVADVYIGTWEQPAKDIYAANFNLIFPANLIKDDAVAFRYNSQSFLGTNTDVTVFAKAPQPFKEGELNVALSRLNGKNVSGFGKIGEVSFTINHDIIGSRNVDETFFTVKAEHVKLVDVDGNELPHETDEDGATIIIVNDILAREGRALNTPQATVFPNPASDQLYIQLRNLTGERLEIFNVAGQRVLSDQVRGDQLAIDTKGLRSGLYTIKIHTEEGVITRRVLLQ